MLAGPFQERAFIAFRPAIRSSNPTFPGRARRLGAPFLLGLDLGQGVDAARTLW
jgi:hypothetical protein